MGLLGMPPAFIFLAERGFFGSDTLPKQGEPCLDIEFVTICGHETAPPANLGGV